jgi:hypothetical protein
MPKTADKPVKPIKSDPFPYEALAATFERVLPMILAMVTQNRVAEREFEMELLKADREYALERLKIMAAVEEEDSPLSIEKLQEIIMQTLDSMARAKTAQPQ